MVLKSYKWHLQMVQTGTKMNIVSKNIEINTKENIQSTRNRTFLHNDTKKRLVNQLNYLIWLMSTKPKACGKMSLGHSGILVHSSELQTR